MARKIAPAADAGAAPRQQRAASRAERELEILHPEREIAVGGRRLTVREYGFVEGLKLRETAAPFLEALYRLAQAAGSVPTFAEVEAMLVAHDDTVLDLIARAADVDRAFIDALSDEEGYLLMQTWWLVNAGFFIRRVINRLATERALRQPAGDASTPRSSGPDTDADRPTSDATPPVN